MSLLTHEDRVRQRAYELFLERGEGPGSEESDWLRAEAEIQAEDASAIDEPSDDLLTQAAVI